MQKILFVWLGSKRSRKWDVGSGGRGLDLAAAAGLPVPAGGILLAELYSLLLEEQVIEAKGVDVLIPDPAFFKDTLYQAVRFPKLDTKVVVRPVYSLAESSGQTAPLPGGAIVNVNPDDPAQLAGAVTGLLKSASKWEAENPGIIRRDLLIMEMVSRNTNGRARISPDGEPDVVDHDSGPSDRLTTIAQLGSWKRPDRSLPAYAQRLQLLLRGIRRTFGDGKRQVEWIDDGRICWLIGLEELS